MPGPGGGEEEEEEDKEGKEEEEEEAEVVWLSRRDEYSIICPSLSYFTLLLWVFPFHGNFHGVMRSQGSRNSFCPRQPQA